jgi:hypothetical protein
LNSWLAFVQLHHFPIEPNPDTMSFFIVYMSRHIRPRSVKSYLSGIVQQLEADFPTIKETRASRLVVKTLKGCLKTRSKPIRRKEPLTLADIRYLETKSQSSRSHDDLLFAALIITGFHGLLRLGDMTFPDDPNLRNWGKVTKRSSLILRNHSYQFLLPSHKADKFFEGNAVHIRAFNPTSFDPLPIFHRYLLSRDHLFPAASPLWLTSERTVPFRSFFMSCFQSLFPKSFGGASMRAGGATHLATLGTPSQLIRALGRWSSDAWEIYIRVHPALLQALLHHH